MNSTRERKSDKVGLEGKAARKEGKRGRESEKRIHVRIN